MTLEPEMREFIAHSQSFLRPGYIDAPINQQRCMYAALCRAYDFARPAGLEVCDFTIPGPAGEIPVRLYRRPDLSLQPGLVYMHGGSWYLGGLDSHDSILAELADRAEITVIAIDYRLAPEHPFPAAFEDSLAALDWIVAQADDLAIDARRLGIGGDSAGGNLAAAVALTARDRGEPALKTQLLIYPALDRHDTTAGPAGNVGAPLLEPEEIRFALRCYVGADVMPGDARAAPLLADEFANLPPAAILAAEVDPLLADAEGYLRALNDAGVSAELEVAKGVVHGFLRARRMSPESARAFTWLCDAARRMLG